VPGSFHVGISEEKVALEQGFRCFYLYLPVVIILPGLHTHL
jgi:hypothetical protein